MQLFLCDLEIDDIEKELPRHNDELVDTLANLRIDMDPIRAAKQLLEHGIVPLKINGEYATTTGIKRMLP